jgi:molybdopterin molybdotransferase
VPENADRVVPIEETDGGVDRVVVSSDPGLGRHIRRQGEVLRSGRPLLERGALLTPGALGLLATHGFAKVPVVSEPSVAILTTGDEVVSPETTPAPGQLRDSHTDFLSAAARATTSNVTPLGIVEDDAVAIAERVEEGLLADVLLVSGGVSMGEFDLVEGVLREAGCDFLFDSVSIQPGKPLAVARHEGGLVFGLPGNPASAMVCFWLFVRPALRRLRGLRDEFWQGALSARSLEPLPGSRGRDLFLPAEVRFEQGEPLARTVLPRGSHDLAAYARGTALARIPASSEPAPAGSRCEVLPLENWTATAQP